MPDSSGGILGYFMGNNERDRNGRLIGEAENTLDQANPDVQVIDQGPTSFDSLSTDPATRSAQMGALQDYQGIINNGGLDATMRGQLAQIQATQGQQASAAEAGAEDARAQRGLTDSGDVAAAQREQVSQAADRASAAGTQAAAQGQQNKMAALGAYGGLASQVHGQDYSEAANRASAEDTVAARNANNRQQQLQENYGNYMAKAKGYDSTADESLKKRAQDDSESGGFLGSLGKIAGGVAGGMFGGPLGAAAGSAIGGAL